MSDARVEVKLCATVDPSGFLAFFEAMLGIWPPAPLDPDVARWEDDGGPPAPDPIRYTHTILPPDDPGYTGPWWPTYRLVGGERVPTQHTGPPLADAVPLEYPTLHEWQLTTLKGLYVRGRQRFVAKTIHIDGGTYRDMACPNCGRHRVHGAGMLDEDGVCEKCGWDMDGNDYATVTRRG